MGCGMRKTCIVTGANSGIGFSTAKRMAANDYKTILAVRNVLKGKAAAERIRQEVGECELSVVQLDLSSLESIHTAAKEILNNNDRLDVLVNNAGIYSTKYMKTTDGFEANYGVNFLGPFLFTRLLLDKLRNTAGKVGEARIIFVSSYGYKMSKGLDFSEPFRSEEEFDSGRAYGDSKLALIYLAAELAKRYGSEGIIANAINPGTVRTELVRRENVSMFYYAIVSRLMRLPILTISPEKPAEAIYFLTSTKDASRLNGHYWDLKKLSEPFFRQDKDMQAKQLWETSLKYVNYRKENE
jgi:NAD(P)-dependent dehydrogenase (short-subunit alcohol dehydrogenase family)